MMRTGSHIDVTFGLRYKGAQEQYLAEIDMHLSQHRLLQQTRFLNQANLRRDGFRQRWANFALTKRRKPLAGADVRFECKLVMASLDGIPNDKRLHGKESTL